MKAILISIKPKYVADILNGKKTIEIRKKFPKDYVGWVYIYCTKGKPYLFHEKGNVFGDDIYELTNDSTSDLPNYKHAYVVGGALNGKVVARFWCDKVEEIEHRLLERHYTETLNDKELLTKSCLSHEEIHNYLRTNIGYAIHINDLEIFDKPKELSEFYHYTTKRDNVKGIIHNYEELTRAPQSFMFVEI